MATVTKLTLAGKAELEEELNKRKMYDRERIAQAIDVARQQGDLSENADYKAAREEQTNNETRIQEIENMLKNVEIVNAKHITVEYVKLHKVMTFEVCGSESKPFENKISSDSPLAKAVAQHKKGDVFIMTTESGKDIEVKLVNID